MGTSLVPSIQSLALVGGPASTRKREPGDKAGGVGGGVEGGSIHMVKCLLRLGD